MQYKGSDSYSGFMSQSQRFRSVLRRAASAIPFVLPAITALLSFTLPLRSLPISENPALYSGIGLIGALLCVVVSAHAFARYYGARDRMYLVLSVGFGITGFIELAAALDLLRDLTAAASILDSTRAFRIEGAMLLAECLVLAVFVEQPFPYVLPRQDARKFFTAVTAIYLVGALYFLFAGGLHIHAGAKIPRPWELLPALIFFFAGIALHRRRYRTFSLFDRALTIAAWMNCAAYIVDFESAKAFDGPHALAQLLRISSFGVVLGGSLWDHSRLFLQNRVFRSSDALTGLGNYRRLIDALEAEIERSDRTHRRFSLLLLDIAKLRTINDEFGMDTGNRALRRVAKTLRLHARLIDTTARCGGDEFALLLPETDHQTAEEFAQRISNQLAQETEQPRVAVSTGIVTYPDDGTTTEALFAVAQSGMAAGSGEEGT